MGHLLDHRVFSAQNTNTYTVCSQKPETFQGENSKITGTDRQSDKFHRIPHRGNDLIVVVHPGQYADMDPGFI